jgi:hypothetical protein
MQSSRFGPDSDVYKRKPKVLGFSFFMPHPDSLATARATTAIDRQRARWWTPGRWLRWPRLPDLNARWRRFPGRWRRLPDPEGERRRGPCAGKRRLPDPEGERWQGPCAGRRRRHFQGRRASGAPRRASSDGDARGARFERRHGRCEVRAAMIAHDILRSGTVRAARVTTYICACVVVDVLRRLHPQIRVFFSIIVFYAYHMYYLR